MQKNPVQTGFFKLENCKNQVQIDRRKGIILLADFFLHSNDCFMVKIIHKSFDCTSISFHKLAQFLHPSDKRGACF